MADTGVNLIHESLSVSQDRYLQQLPFLAWRMFVTTADSGLGLHSTARSKYWHFLVLCSVQNFNMLFIFHQVKELK